MKSPGELKSVEEVAEYIGEGKSIGEISTNDGRSCTVSTVWMPMDADSSKSSGL